MEKDHIEMQELVRRKLNGESYSTIRSGLEEKGYPPEEVSEIIRKVDERVLREEMGQGARRKSQARYRTGLAIAVLGLALVVGANAGWFLANTPRWLAYAPFFAGILIMLYGKRVPGKQAGPDLKSGGRIRNKRPYK